MFLLQEAMLRYADVNAKQVPILRPQMYAVMLPLLAQYGTDTDVTAAFQEIIDKQYTLTIRCVVNITFDSKKPPTFQDLMINFHFRPFHLTLKNYIVTNRIQNAMALLDKMEQCNVKPDITMFGELFCGLDLTKDSELVSTLFEKMKHFDIKLDTPLFNLFLKRKKEMAEAINNRGRNSRDNPLATIQMALDIIAHMRAHNLQPDAR